MNYYVKCYKSQRNNGFKPLDAFGIIASVIAVCGTIEDLQAVRKYYEEDSTKALEELDYERINATVSAS